METKIKRCHGFRSCSHIHDVWGCGPGAAAGEGPPDRIPNWCLPSAIAPRFEAFRQGLRELGYVEGKNIVIEWRSCRGKTDRLPALAAELVGLKVDVIVTGGSGLNPCRQGSNFYDSHCHDAG